MKPSITLFQGGELIQMVEFRIRPQHVEASGRLSVEYARGSVLTVPGCRRFDVLQDLADPSHFSFYKVFDDEDARDAHKDTEYFRKAHDRERTKGWVAGGSLSECRPIFPVGRPAPWASTYPPGNAGEEGPRGGMFISHGPLLVQSDRVDDFASAVSLMATRSTEDEPGCLRFDVHQNRENQSEFYLYEVYVDQATFDHHGQSAHARQWQQTTKDWYAPEFSIDDNPRLVIGTNVWPSDDWFSG